MVIGEDSRSKKRQYSLARMLVKCGFVIGLFSVNSVLSGTNAAFAQPVDGIDPVERKEQHIEELIQKAQGSPIRVIVMLNVSFIPEGELDEKEIRDQRLSIQSAGQSLLGELTEDGLPDQKEDPPYTSTFTPVIALSVDESGLQRLKASTLVFDVIEDESILPILAESIPLIRTPDAWNGGFTGQGYTIAILDTGVDGNHTMLSGKVVEQACYSSSTSSSVAVCPSGSGQQVGPGSAIPCSFAGCDHGTHVAGIAAGTQVTIGTKTYSGVAKDANLIAVQVFSRFNSAIDCPGMPTPCPRTFTSDQIQGLDRVYSLSVAGTHDIASVNMSIGGGKNTSPCDSHPVRMSVDNLKSRKIATVIASGNDGFKDALSAPGCISTAVSVGSTTDVAIFSAPANLVSSFTNRASFLDLMAPGDTIASAVPGGSGNNALQAKSGTSMAAPHVAGAWALMKQQTPQASVDDILLTLQTTGLQVDDAASSLSFKRVTVPEFPLSIIILGMAIVPVIYFARKYSGSFSRG